ncbi:hypothetical protein BA6E_102222 [Bacteroidales bacterium 6E]|nr:hypothetical protein BA6E_102222 [Bacteroidales bacterium 6E]
MIIVQQSRKIIIIILKVSLISSNNIYASFEKDHHGAINPQAVICKEQASFFDWG